MRWSLQVQYGVYAMFDLAYNGRETPVQVRVIGERQQIPTRYLEQIFQRLRRARLVEGKRGPGGGYRLSRAPAEITLLDIVEAIEGPLSRSLVPTLEPRGRRPVQASRPGFLWEGVAEGVARSLATTTLESLCREAARRAVKRADADSHTYVI
ncbi:MAG: Rrf2 family transcriptional regulator [Deltaproteobacteria bacterium]|nr:Rrf2 family transcriptional regulator [Deltaproteobacteria bacterium]MBW2445058.1 Rrf2 family transcriptional regulator [Deltaproteobacteria bacterium]